MAFWRTWFNMKSTTSTESFLSIIYVTKKTRFITSTRKASFNLWIMQNMSKTILFFGTDDFSLVALQALFESGYNIAAVITKPDSKSAVSYTHLTLRRSTL